MSNYHDMDIENIDIKEEHNDDQVDDDQQMDLKPFVKDLKKWKTINLFNAHPEVIPRISEIVEEYTRAVSEILAESNPDVRNMYYWESLEKYTEAKNILDCISETLSAYPHEPGVYEPTYLDIFKFWLRISHELLDFSKIHADTFWDSHTCILSKSSYPEDLELVENIYKIKWCIQKIDQRVSKKYNEFCKDLNKDSEYDSAFTLFTFGEDSIAITAPTHSNILADYTIAQITTRSLKSQYMKVASFYRIDNEEIRLTVYRIMTKILTSYCAILSRLTRLMESNPIDFMKSYLKNRPHLEDIIVSTIQDIIKFGKDGFDPFDENLKEKHSLWKLIRSKLNQPLNSKVLSNLTLGNITNCSTIYLKESNDLNIDDFDLTMIDIIVKYFYYMEHVYFKTINDQRTYEENYNE